MPPSYVHTRKMKPMEKIIHDHCQMSKMEKKSMRSNRSWNIEEGDEVMSTWSNGLDIQSPKPCGNRNLVSQAWWRSYKNTKNTTSYKISCLSSGRRNQLPISTNPENTGLMMSSRNASSWKASLKTWSENIYICFDPTNTFNTPLPFLSTKSLLNSEKLNNRYAFHQNWPTILC